MMLLKLVVMLLMLLPCALGRFGSVKQCDAFSCRGVCIVDNSCDSVVQRFHKECDDPYWDEVGVVAPQAEDLCTQCCDKNCEAVQTFPNCTGEECNQCYEDSDSSGESSTETYDMHCCEIDGQLRCSLCTMPDGWNADWTTEIENELPDGAVFSFGDEDLCSDIPYEGECVTWDVDVTSQGGSCQLTQDIKCRGWYYSETTPDCERCLPSPNKVQFVTSSFERRTVQCKAGDDATCQKLPPTITDVSIQCTRRDPCELDINGAYGFLKGLVGFATPGTTDPPPERQRIKGDYGVPDLNEPSGSLNFLFPNDPTPFRFEVNPPNDGDGRVALNPDQGTDFTYRFNRAPDFTDPATGQLKDHTVCRLSLRVYPKEGETATVTFQDVQLTIGENAPIDLGTFSHNSSETGPVVQEFCRDDYDEFFSFTGTVMTEGELRDVENRDQWFVLVECGTAFSTCSFMSR
eukprot:CAMPEP_0113966362 /NCGR_PEP_ID=MMETSP0011_2-20120614/8289_1 /TAXON_ID=101924 /ORGANISM="Rhodosorus marinus" /LENGTH=460 /DNA_ID=CAMNT_0000979039 /DNA_START=56 /DNA_END=1438 /DNA_ORIENTATION=+ /assembly_acc=CAM_ASM_000156